MRNSRLATIAAASFKAGCLALPLIALPLSAGCFDNDRPRHRDRVVVREERVVDAPPPPPERVVVREVPPPPGPVWFDEPRYKGDRYERDDHDRHGRADKNVPKAAREVAIGRGVISWQADRECHVWVTDSEHDAVMWDGRVSRGEVVDVVPRHNRIFVGRREVGRYDHMKDEIRYRIWSAPGTRF